jgi:hypothetical protein
MGPGRTAIEGSQGQELFADAAAILGPARRLTLAIHLQELLEARCVVRLRMGQAHDA